MSCHTCGNPVEYMGNGQNLGKINYLVDLQLLTHKIHKNKQITLLRKTGNQHVLVKDGIAVLSIAVHSVLFGNKVYVKHKTFGINIIRWIHVLAEHIQNIIQCINNQQLRVC